MVEVADGSSGGSGGDAVAVGVPLAEGVVVVVVGEIAVLVVVPVLY